MTSRPGLYSTTTSFGFDVQDLRRGTDTSRGFIVADSNAESVVREKDGKDKKDNKADNDQLTSKQKFKLLNKKFKKKFSDIQIKEALMNAGDVAGPVLIVVGGILGGIVAVPVLLAGGAVVSVVVAAGGVVGGVLVCVLGPPVMGAIAIVAAIAG